MSWQLEEAITYYQKQGAPGDQTALVSLLREIAREHGGSIPAFLLPQTAQALGVKESYLLAIVKRIPSLRLSEHHSLVLCAGPNCGKSTELLALAEQLEKASGGKLVVKTVPCMRMCGKGPNLKWDGQLHHRATEELLRSLAAGKGSAL